MTTTIFDLYLETIATEVDRLISDDFGVMCVDAKWDVSSLESILHERHQVFNEMNIVELDKELCDTDKTKMERHITKIASLYCNKMYLAKDILTTDNKTVRRQYSQMDDCLKILKADSETTERIKSSYESLLLKYSMAVREFLQEMDDFRINLNSTEMEQEKPKIDKRRNIIDYFKDASRIDEVKCNVDGKTGATLVSVLKKYIDDDVIETFPSYGSLIKDWNFPDDKRLENNYRQAKKNKL